jgi:hypothetical protein
MAITRSQQARQMLKTAGAVEQDGVLNYIKNSESVTVPKEFKARKNAPATKLAYITTDEAKMLKKKKPGTPHKGPKGIPSYDSFDAQGGFTSGAAMSAAETGSSNARDRAEVRASNIGAPRGAGPGVRSNQEQELRASAIAAGAGQRVNPGFFDSRNRISPQELALARAFSKDPNNLFARQAMKRTRGGGIMNFITSGGLLGNLIRGLGQRFGLGKRFDQPTYDMRRFSGINPTFQDDLDNSLLMQLAKEDDNQIPIVIDNDMSLVPDRGLMIAPGDNITPFQQDIIEDQNYDEQVGDIRDIMAADGGMIGGGIMDAAGRQNYFLGKLVKKATRAVKKVVKSPVGKLALLASPFLASSAARTGLMNFLFKKGTLASGLTGGGKFALGAGISALPLLFGQEEEQQPTGFTGSVGGQIDPKAYTDPYGVLFGAFKAEGGSMKDEPVAKRTMPLLDMGGQEMDLRAEGGFVPIGRMEKADDVPARLSKNEFVFTADAVRNAGDGDVDKGAEVMYNMMKNLEAGGEVSEESQGLEGAREMFQTSKRLEDVI